MFCRNCGKEINENANVCLGCGVFVQDTKKIKTAAEDYTALSKYNWIFALISLVAGINAIIFALIIDSYAIHWILASISLLFGIFTLTFSIMAKEKDKFRSILAFAISISVLIFAIVVTVA